MLESAKLNIVEGDQSTLISNTVTGIVAVSLVTKRGPFGHNDEIITSWPQFVELYGGEGASYPGATLAKDILYAGGKLRVNRVGHYTTISDASTLDATKAAIDESGANDFAQFDSTKCFNLVPKYEGADYNNLQIVISNASNGDADAFNLQVNHLLESGLNETYTNIYVSGNPSAADAESQNFLEAVVTGSKLVDVTYLDLSGTTGTVRPANGIWDLTTGSNGTTPVDADYSGDAAGNNGHHAFSGHDDFYYMAALDNFNSAVNATGAAYAENRADCFYIISLPYSNTSASTIATARSAGSVDSRFAVFVSGGVVNADNENQSELGDFIAANLRVDRELGPWRAASGSTNGKVSGRLGVVNNFGSYARSGDLDVLAGNQVNMVIQRNGTIYITGNFTGQVALSRKSFFSIQKLFVYLSKTLRPLLESYLEGEANDIPTWQAIFRDVTKVLEPLANGRNRALASYEWKGDQNAENLDALQVNTKTDVLAGRYKAVLEMVEVNTLQVFTLEVNSVQGDSVTINQG